MMTLASRLWSRTVPDGDCLVYVGTRTDEGYGRIKNNRRGFGTHRVAWELTYGPIPSGLHVLHRCDNRPCVRPEHLFLGTNADNQADMIAKGRARGAQGSANTFARLDEPRVALIRRRHASGATSDDLARAFGVSRRTINDVVSRKYWRHVPEAAPEAESVPLFEPLDAEERALVGGGLP